MQGATGGGSVALHTVQISTFLCLWASMEGVWSVPQQMRYIEQQTTGT